jgi:hypothetical protein
VNNNVWSLLSDLYTEFPHIKCLNADEDKIKLAESALKLNFSNSYKYFLKYHECSAVGELRIYTLTRSEDSPMDTWSVVDAEKWYKKEQNWPDIDDWYIVSDNGSGDPIGIKPNGEVWISYHDSGFEQEKLADDFEEFVYKLLTETLWG